MSVSAKVAVLSRSLAYDAKAAGDTVFALDPKIATLSAFELANAKPRWSTAVGVVAHGRVGFFPSFGTEARVLVHVENHLVTFDPKSGARLADEPGPWSTDQLHFEDARGACTFASDCAVHFLDCRDAHPIGPVLRIAETHLYAKLGAPHDTVCWGPRHVLGRAGKRIVAVTDGRTLEPKTQEATLLAFDVDTAKTAWTRPAPALAHVASSGISPDGSTCWIAADEGRLEVFDCASGVVRFHKVLDPAEGRPRVHTTWAAGGLFVSTASKAMLFDAKSGATIWSRTIGAKALALPLATKLELEPYSSWEARTVLLLDPKTGKTAAQFPLPAYTELRQDADLGLAVASGPAFDPKGVARTVPPTKPRFSIDRDKTPKTLADRGTVIAEVTSDLAVVTQTDEVVVLFVWPVATGPGELVFLRP